MLHGLDISFIQTRTKNSLAEFIRFWKHTTVNQWTFHTVYAK